MVTETASSEEIVGLAEAAAETRSFAGNQSASISQTESMYIKLST